MARTKVYRNKLNRIHYTVAPGKIVPRGEHDDKPRGVDHHYSAKQQLVIEFHYQKKRVLRHRHCGGDDKVRIEQLRDAWAAGPLACPITGSAVNSGPILAMFVGPCLAELGIVKERIVTEMCEKIRRCAQRAWYRERRFASPVRVPVVVKIMRVVVDWRCRSGDCFEAFGIADLIREVSHKEIVRRGFPHYGVQLNRPFDHDDDQDQNRDDGCDDDEKADRDDHGDDEEDFGYDDD